MVFLSLGTGQVVTPYEYSRVQHWGIFDWLKPLLDIFMTGEAETVDFQLRHIFAAEGAADQYLRLNPILGPHCSPDLDNASRENTDRLQNAGLKMVRDADAELDHIAELLVRAGHKR
jgi:uncharacterized protein